MSSFDEGEYTFFIPSGDHRPPHVHVEYDGDEAVFHLTPVEMRDNFGIPKHELGDIVDSILENRTRLLKMWLDNRG